MSSFTRRRLGLFGFATLFAAFTVAPAVAWQTAAAAPTHTAAFDVGGQAYTGVTTFAVDKAGAVTGTMKLDNPAQVDAKLNGTIKDGVWSFNYAFTMNNQGQMCSGTVSGTAKVNADHSDVSGAVSIGGDCGADAQSGTFSFKKRTK